ncbi:MAG: RNA polymerase sigma factor [Janthinobacterium lividum]
MLDAATREEQATACLEAAEKHRGPLLALATKLAGCPEEGMNLFQQTVLDCHDAIQRNGFAGDRYEFYLYTSLRNYYHRQQKKHLRELRVDFQQVESGSSSRDDEGPAPWAAKAHQKRDELKASTHASTTDELAHLADQVQEELRTRFPPAHRVALRLHVAGYSCREIADMTGGNEDQSCIWRRIERMKAVVRATFRQAWEGLSEPEY